MSTLTLNLKSKTRPVILEGDAGPESFEIREMSATQRDKYLDRMTSRFTIDGTGKRADIKKYEGLQAELLSSCMYRMSTGELVKIDEIQKWPSSAATALFEAAQEINLLANTKLEKND